MLALLIDNDFKEPILRGLLAREPAINLIRVPDVHLRLAPDDAILQWAADNARVVVTHDVNTMTGFAYQRVMRREPMPGVVAVSQTLGVRTAIEQLLLATVCYEADDIADQVLFIPW